MDRDVKRPYHAPGRAARAAETRRRLLAAAHTRFLADGYVATTVAAIARDAGVAEATAFAAFGSKRALLLAAIGAAVGGDAAPTPLLSRPEWRAMLDAPDPADALHRFAAFTAAGLARGAALIEVARTAAAVEPELAALVREGGRSRWADCRALAGALHARGQLRADLSMEAATDLLWVHCSSELWHLLVTERGWTGEQYQTWVAEALTAALLPGR
ncbi:MAG TPA: helix-turn-helix domain-containing protein [Thermomicrobiales bacterium]|nr:helix-turn-helix domain-containing protein [Thermomicrobiales bacterium]